MDENTKQLLKTMGELLRTQDNSITAGPIFMVEKKVRSYGYEDGYTDLFAWIDDGDEVDETMAKELEARYIQSGKTSIKGCNRVGYKERWEPVQPFFTRNGAEDYIFTNKHNLGESRIYVHGSYRNFEWQAVREYLLNLKEESEPVHYGIWADGTWLRASNGLLFSTSSRAVADAQIEAVKVAWGRNQNLEVRPYGQATTK